MIDSVFHFLVATMMLSAVSATFNPTVKFDSCDVGPIYTFTITDAAVGGKVYIADQCTFQTVTNATTQTFVFDTTVCSVGTLSAIGTSFDLRVQRYADFETENDLLVQSTCNLDLSTVTQNVTLSASDDVCVFDPTNVACTVDSGDTSSGEQTVVDIWILAINNITILLFLYR